MKLVYLALFSGVVATGLAGASNYMYESSSVNGVGYKAEERIIQIYDANYLDLSRLEFPAYLNDAPKISTTLF